VLLAHQPRNSTEEPSLCDPLVKYYGRPAKWFIGLNPKDPLPETSLLTKFRTQRLKGTTMDAIMAEIMRQCAEKGIIKNSNGLMIDVTDSEASSMEKHRL